MWPYFVTISFVVMSIYVAGESEPRPQNVATERVCSRSKNADFTDDVVRLLCVY